MPIVIVEMFEGRTVEQKRELAGSITSAFVKIGTPAEVVRIFFHDIAKHNVAIGGKLASDSK